MGADNGDDFIDIIESNDQSFQDVGAFLCLFQVKDGSAGDNLFLELDVFFQHLAQGQGLWLSVDQSQHNDADSVLQLGIGIQLIEHQLGVGIAFELDDNLHALAAGVVADVANLVDLLFLDIQMPELNGLEFSQMVDSRTRIVFTTAFGQYAIDGYRVNALDYLLKPISYVDFLQAANKALQWFELVQKPEEIDSIFVKSDYKLVQVELKKIMYIEGLKDYIKIYTEDDAKPILSLMSMKAMEELLPSSRFIRVHRSFIVQKDKIRVIDRGRIVFDKTYIPISDSYKQVFQAFLDERS